MIGYISLGIFFIVILLNRKQKSKLIKAPASDIPCLARINLMFSRCGTFR